jgi:hypothetical protein
MSDDDPTAPDHLVNLGECEDGTTHVVGLKDGRPVRAGHARLVKDGQTLPPHGDVYFIDTDTGRVMSHTRLGNGPAQVATPTYRKNWDAIFGAQDPEGLN